MSKITRYNGNLKAFASEATGTERTIFGDTAQSDTLDANITLDLLRGWGVIGVESNPTKQHFNGLAFTLGQLIAYLHQRGVPEWNAAQEYYAGSVVTTLAGIYRLKSGGVGSSDPDTDGGVNWELIPTQAKVDAKADQATTYTETEVDGLLDAKADQATTYTKLETVAEFNQYGLGAGSVSDEPNIDLILTAGTYISVGSGHVNFPPGDNNRAIITIGGGSNYIKQEIQQVRSPYRRFYRASPTAVIGAQAWIEIAQLSGAAGLTVTVGTGGDYPTINAALEYLSKLQPVYDSAGIAATINLLTGFTMAEQVLVRGLNLGWVTITGADAETTITNTALTTNFTSADYGFNSYPAFGVSKGGVLPRVDQLFRFNVANVGGSKHGIMAVGAGSSADVLPGAGVNDAGTVGIYAANGSTINAYAADASGAGTYGILATNGSTINASSADASGAGTYGFYASNGSTINAEGAVASGAGSTGIVAADGSTINAYTATGTLSQAINTVTRSGIIFQ